MPPAPPRKPCGKKGGRGLIELKLPQELLMLCIRALVTFGDSRRIDSRETRDVIACGAVSRHFRASAILAGLTVRIGGLRTKWMGLPAWTGVLKECTSVAQISCGDMVAAFAPWNVRRAQLSFAPVSDVIALGCCHTLGLFYLPNVQSVDGLGTCHTVTIVALPITHADALATCRNVWLELCANLVDVSALCDCYKVTVVDCPSITTTDAALARVPCLCVEDGGTLRDTGF